MENFHFNGNFQAKHTRMSKRGSRVLRYALMNAAHNVVKNNTTFKAYYAAKMAEGRTHYNALGHCAGKLVRVIWKMLTDEAEFTIVLLWVYVTFYAQHQTQQGTP